MFRNYFFTALKLGPLSMLIFMISLKYLMVNDFMDAESAFMIFAVGSFITTIIALVAAVVVYGIFERVHTYLHLRLSPNDLFHFFLPLLLFGFGAILGAILWWKPDEFVLSMAISAYISSVLGWSFFCRSRSREA